MFFAYHLTSVLRAKHRSHLFRIAVAEHFVFTLRSSFTSAPSGRPVEYLYVIDGATPPGELDILLPLPAGVHVFVDEVDLFSVLPGSQFDLKQDCLAYHRRREVEREERASLTWFPYDTSSGDVLYILVDIITTSKKTVSDVQVMQ